MEEFIVVADSNIKNVIHKVKERFMLGVLEIKRCSIYKFVHGSVFLGQDTLEICFIFKSYLGKLKYLNGVMNVKLLGETLRTNTFKFLFPTILVEN